MILASFAVVIWLGLLGWPDRAWQMRERLESNPESTLGERVTVLMPARNEEAVLRCSLDALANQRVPLKIWILNDGSTDRTREVALATHASNLEVLDIPSLPPGWSGKLWALEQGFARVTTNWILLLDADIALARGILPTLLVKAECENLDLLSIMATPARQGFWDRWLMPVFIYFFKWLYPFHRSNDPQSRVAAAAGGCLLVKREILAQVGGFAALRAAVIDDCTLARLVKQKGFRIWIGVSRSVVMLRDHSFRQIWDMVARTAFTQLKYSYLALAGTLLGLGVVFAIPPILVLSGSRLGALIAGCAWILMTLSYAPTARYYDESPFVGLFLPLAAMLFCMMSLDSALRYALGTRSRWKGRSYDRT